MRSKNPELMNRIHHYVNEFCLETSRTPSVSEIAQALGISKGTVHNYLKAMNEREMISYQDGELLTRVTKKCRMEQVGIPLAGIIPCGPPEEEVENIEEYIFMPRALLGEGKFFILRADGDSMVDAGIDEGDLVVVRRQLEAIPGQIVAVLVDGGSSLKRLRYNFKVDRYELHPENKVKNYPLVEGNHISIQGVAVKVLKSLE